MKDRSLAAGHHDNGKIVAVLMLSGFVGSLSQNMLTSALPAIMESYRISAAVGQWLTTSYILVMGIITAISAFLFYRFNTKRLVLCSLALFMAGCLIAFWAPDFPVLLAARILQAVGAGPLIPLLQIAVLHLYPPERQGFALGLTGIIVGFAPAVGPTLSGILVDHFGWRSVFVFLIILCAAALAAGQFVLRDIGQRKETRLSAVSIALYSAGFILVMLSVTWMKGGAFLSPRVLLGLAAGTAALVLFVRKQNREEDPFLRLSLLRHRSLVLACFLLGTAYVLNMAGTILVPLFNQTICTYTATVSGLLLLPGSLVIALCSPVSGKLTDRFGARRVCLAGMAANILGNLLFLTFTPNTGPWPIAAAYGFRGLGMALVMTPSSALAVQDVALEDKAHAMAILNSFRQMSGSLFSTILVIIATVASLPASAINLHGVHMAFLTMTILSAAGLAASFAVRSPHSRP